MLRILTVDDSKVVSLLLKSIFEQQTDMLVVGQAGNGKEGVEMALSLKPDLITMDIRMPVMDGFEATRLIMEQLPTPIIVISSHVDDEELGITFRAIEAGALVVLEKPVGFMHSEFESQRRDLVDTVRAMSQVRLFKKHAFRFKPDVRLANSVRKHNKTYDLLAIGCSTGGPQVLHQIFSLLPKDFPVPIVVTQHIAKGFIGGLVSWLSHNTQLKVKLAEQGEPLLPGSIYFAPDNLHLTVLTTPLGLTVHLTDQSPANGFRPSIDPMFTSVALSCQNRAVGVLLTGMGTDGALGLKTLRNRGGHTLVQDEESSVVYGMPGAALELAAVDQVVEIGNMAVYLNSIVSKG